ncbi:MAG: ankyrin repeat domain-containing protein [Syntrophaceae bacterium]|nr:ankyrin repeat domain-containing protein [Syntrophaceae bacterium]
MKGYAELVRLLAGHGAAVDGVNNNQRTALYYAAKHGYRRVADVLSLWGRYLCAPGKLVRFRGLKSPTGKA